MVQQILCTQNGKNKYSTSGKIHERCYHKSPVNNNTDFTAQLKLMGSFSSDYKHHRKRREGYLHSHSPKRHL